MYDVEINMIFKDNQTNKLGVWKSNGLVERKSDSSWSVPYAFEKKN